MIGQTSAQMALRDPDIRLSERRRVIHAVAGHRHHVLLCLQRSDDFSLSLWQDARLDALERNAAPACLGRERHRDR